MHIFCIGLNHQTAQVCVREQLAFTEEAVKSALTLFHEGKLTPAGVDELVILSTCNRVEMYAAAENVSHEALAEFLAGLHGVSSKSFKEKLYHFTDEGAVDHLFRVAAGLDSMVLGEAQILGQVSRAFDLAREKGTAGPVLSRLLQSAIFTGKRARTETGISQNSSSISSIAVKLASECVPDLPGASVAVLGAGEMAELAVEALRKRGVEKIQVVNRSLERAQDLASRWKGEAYTFKSLHLVISNSDILIASTGAPHAFIYPETIRHAFDERRERPLVIIDIAMPRDVVPEVGLLPGVALYDLDHLQSRLEEVMTDREREVPKVEVILSEEKADFQDYLKTLDVLPLIAQIRQQAEALRQAELEKTLRHLPNLSEDERRRIDALTNAIVKKILGRPLVRLKSKSGSPQSAQFTTLTRDLFGLEDRG
jgi:glutamyl-tRNA reductase